jgi:hypothetical protein
MLFNKIFLFLISIVKNPPKLGVDELGIIRVSCFKPTGILTACPMGKFKPPALTLKPAAAVVFWLDGESEFVEYTAGVL